MFQLFGIVPKAGEDEDGGAAGIYRLEADSMSRKEGKKEGMFLSL